jgi:hypothetical protein
MEDGTQVSENETIDPTVKRKEEYQQFLGELQQKLHLTLNPTTEHRIGFALFLFDVTGKKEVGSMVTNALPEQVLKITSSYVTRSKNIIRNKRKRTK